MIDEFRGTPVSKNVDKAKQASHFKKKLMDTGVSSKNASNLALHELGHALGDKGKSGLFGFQKENNLVKPYYEAEGSRSIQEKLNYLKAPHVLSTGDKSTIKSVEKFKATMIVSLGLIGCTACSALLYFAVR